MVDRFFAKVSKTDKCWIWTAYRDACGYGHFRDGRRVHPAHRFSWMLTNGKVPDGMLVLHKCDNPACVNPEHLFLGTDADNMRDRDNKGRQARGARHGRAKFTEADVGLIRMLKRSGLTIKEISIKMGAPSGTVSNICTGHTWRNGPW